MGDRLLKDGPQIESNKKAPQTMITGHRTEVYNVK